MMAVVIIITSFLSPLQNARKNQVIYFVLSCHEKRKNHQKEDGMARERDQDMIHPSLELRAESKLREKSINKRFFFLSKKTIITDFKNSLVIPSSHCEWSQFFDSYSLVCTLTNDSETLCSLIIQTRSASFTKNIKKRREKTKQKETQVRSMTCNCK